jgi:hypothetical protein
MGMSCHAIASKRAVISADGTNRHAEVVVSCPLSGEMRKSELEPATSGFDPLRSSATPKHISSDGSPEVFQMARLDSYTAAS